MRYNLSAILEQFDETVPSYQSWIDKIEAFFSNQDYNPKTLDVYYDHILFNHRMIKYLFDQGYIIDDYSGLFTFNTSETRTLHTFNLANFVRRNHRYFYKKKIHTFCSDYGILNVQTKLCGLDLVNSYLPLQTIMGSMLLVIGNQCAPYEVNHTDTPDVIIASNIFSTEDDAWTNWNYLFDEKLSGKEVFFSSYSFNELQKFINYDKIKQVEDPLQVYDKDTYSNGDLGYMNRIYQIV